MDTHAESASENYLINGDFEKVIATLESNCSKPEDYYILSRAYHFSGFFLKEYDTWKAMLKKFSGRFKEDEEVFENDGLRLTNLFEVEIFSGLKLPNDLSCIQSREHPDQTYIEGIEAQELLKEYSQWSFNEIDQAIDNPGQINREQLAFMVAELLFISQDYINAARYYDRAININPNKALYWGYSSNELSRYCSSGYFGNTDDSEELLCDCAFQAALRSGVAIELDSKNARWHFYHGLNLQLLAITKEIFIIQAKKEVDKAIGLCRLDQIQLLNVCKEVKSNLDKIEDVEVDINQGSFKADGEMTDSSEMDEVEFNRYRHFFTKVVGVTVEDRQSTVKRLKNADALRLVREPSNPYDSNAIAVISDSGKVGYIKKEIASVLASYMDLGYDYNCTVAQVTGGGELNYGLNIKIDLNSNDTCYKPIYNVEPLDNDYDVDVDYEDFGYRDNSQYTYEINNYDYKPGDSAPWDDCSADPDMCCGYDH